MKQRRDERFLRGLDQNDLPISKIARTQKWFDERTRAGMNLLGSWCCRTGEESFGGLGLFACYTLLPALIVQEYGGIIKSAKEAKAKGVDVSHHCSFCDGTGRVLAGHTQPAQACTNESGAALGSFVNCFDPAVMNDKLRVNCHLVITTFKTNEVRVFIVTSRVIPAGEALVLNYGARAAEVHHGLGA